MWQMMAVSIDGGGVWIDGQWIHISDEPGNLGTWEPFAVDEGRLLLRRKIEAQAAQAVS